MLLNGQFLWIVLPANTDIHQYIRLSGMNPNTVWGTEVELFAASHFICVHSNKQWLDMAEVLRKFSTTLIDHEL